MKKYFGFRNDKGEMFAGFNRAGEPIWQNEFGSCRLFQDRGINSVVNNYSFLLGTSVVFFDVEETKVLRLVVTTQEIPEIRNAASKKNQTLVP